MSSQGNEVPKFTIIEDGTFEIMPSDIPSDFDHLWNAFNNSQTEVSAAFILMYCQMQGSWAPFSFDQINVFYQYKRKSKRDDFIFNRLIEPGWHDETLTTGHHVGGGWIVKHEGNQLHYVTDDFIRRVYESASKRSKEMKAQA